MADIEKSIAECCKQLKLSTNFAGQAFEQKGDTPQEYLLNLLTNEIEYRTAKRKSKFLNTAGFPRRYRVEEFRTDEIDFPEDVSFQSLLDLDFYHAGKNVIMYGGTGTGKTMLSILIGMSACNQEIPVRFYRTAGLINLFSESQSSGKLTALKKKLNSAQILILDEFGYVPYDRTGSQLLFDYLSEIHEQKSVILNTNLEFSQWVNVLYDQRMTTALIGRLTHHVELILFPGINNRLRESVSMKPFHESAVRRQVTMAKNNKVIKEQNIDQNLQERYEEMNDFLLDLIEDHKRIEEDLKYLKDFVHYKRLDEEFRYFRKHAHEDENSELPFPYLTL